MFHKYKSPNLKEALFSVGLIADPQHADTDDRWNYTETALRRYRRGLEITKNAVKVWNEEQEEASRPTMIICLGDIIDGLNKNLKESTKAMENMLKAFGEFVPNKDPKQSKISNVAATVTSEKVNSNTQQNETAESAKAKEWKMPTYPYFHNLIGNHEMYNFDRIELMKYVFNPTSNPLEYYYSLSPYPGFVFIFLDSYVCSVHGYDYVTTNQDNETEENKKNDSFMQESKRLFLSSKALLQKNNANKDKNSASGMKGEVRRFVAYNGGFGEKQLQWFTAELEKCKKNQDNVFVFAHLPLSCSKGDEDILSWDFDKVRSIIDQFKPIVKVVFAGHDHCGEMTVVNGVYYRTLQGAVESDEDKDCFATAYFYRDKLFLKGYGMIPDELFLFQSDTFIEECKTDEEFDES